jgi:predicted nucleic acid-binding protein
MYILEKLKLYLDNCCFNRPFDNQNQMRINLETEAKLFIQSLIIDKKVDFIWSFILLFENENNPFDARRETIFDFSKHAVEIISANDKILKEAKEIKSSGLKEKDALHIACAVYANCDYFISTDDRILKYETDMINIIDPIDFIKVWEGRNDE